MHRKPFERGCFGFSYEGPLREAMQAFKFRGRKDVGRTLVRMLSDDIVRLGRLFDVIVPMPVTEKRLKERGFNQSYIIGEEIARITGKPLTYSVLRKVRETRDQYTLSKDERKRNIRGAFAAMHGQPDISRKRVLLVDDLYTTGNTASEGALALRRAKAGSISLFALARTP
jgi:ComF family protein